MNERSAADEGAVKLFHGNGSVGLKVLFCGEGGRGSVDKK
jgi:hypothetical protein